MEVVDDILLLQPANSLFSPDVCTLPFNILGSVTPQPVVLDPEQIPRKQQLARVATVMTRMVLTILSTLNSEHKAITFLHVKRMTQVLPEHLQTKGYAHLHKHHRVSQPLSYHGVLLCRPV